MLQYVTDNNYNTIKNNTEQRGNNMLIPALISAAATVGSSIYNAWSQKNANKQNQEYNNHILQNRLQMSVTDAQKAGFSPLAALGVSQPTSGVVSQAPQMDLSSLSNIIASAGGLQLERDKLEENKRQFDMTHPKLHDEYGETLAETKRQNDILQQQADTAATKVQNDYNNFILHESNLVSQFADDLKLRQDIFENDKEFKNNEIKKEFVLNRQESSQRQYEKLCDSLGVAPQVEYVSDWSEFVSKSNASQAIYKDFLQRYNVLMEKTGLKNASSGTSTSNSKGVGLRASDMSSGFGAGGDISTSKSASQSDSKNEHYLRTTLAYELENSGYKFYIYSPKGVEK